MPISRKKKSLRKRFNKRGGDCTAEQLEDPDSVCPISQELLSDIEPQYRVSINRNCYDSRALCRWLSNPDSQMRDAFGVRIPDEDHNSLYLNHCNIFNPPNIPGLIEDEVDDHDDHYLYFPNDHDDENHYLYFPNDHDDEDDDEDDEYNNNNNNNNYNNNNNNNQWDFDNREGGRRRLRSKKQNIQKRKLSKRSKLIMTGGMKIVIKKLDKTTFTLDVNGTDTFRVIKEKIEALSGIPVHRQLLSFPGQSYAANDDYTVSDYNIQEGNTILLVIRSTHQQ